MAPRIPIEERFWPKVDRSAGPDACWPWTGHRNKQGYGQTSMDGKPIGAHRVAFILTFGPIPKRRQIDHYRCDNPPCCNPMHLRPVTAWENNLRSSAPSALNLAKTECPKGHPYDEANTLISDGRRYCRTCLRVKYRAWATPEREAARKRKQRAKNPKVQRQADRRYYAKNRDRLVAEARERRARLRAEKESR